jgi:predicted nucleic acid-binding protein
MTRKAIVLDANILIRAVLGERVRRILHDHADVVHFFAPDAAYADARTYLPALLAKRGIAPATVTDVLDRLEAIVQRMDLDLYADHKTDALRRIGARDADDWPILACALALDCPVWTEDQDFFGTGVATWTSDRVTLYLGA